MYTCCLTSTRSRFGALVRKGLLAGMLSTVAAAGFYGNAYAQKVSEPLVSIAASKPANTAAIGAHFLGWMPPNQQVSLAITLPLRNQAQLQNFLTRLHT